MELPVRIELTLDVYKTPVLTIILKKHIGEPPQNRTGLTCFADRHLTARSEVHWQGQQDSNLQQAILETATLPIELCPSMVAVERFKLSYVGVKVRCLTFTWLHRCGG